MAAFAVARVEGHVGPFPAVAHVPIIADGIVEHRREANGTLSAVIGIRPDIDHMTVEVGGDPWVPPSL